MRESIILGSEDSDASDAELKAMKGRLAKPIKFYFLNYGLRNGRMVLNKQLYASTPNYDIMYGKCTIAGQSSFHTLSSPCRDSMH